MTDFVSTTAVVGSKMSPNPNPKAQKDAGGYGNNYDASPSSLTPGQADGKSNFLLQCELPAENANGQTRTVDATGYKPAAGMSQAPGNKMPEAGATLGSVGRSPKRASGGGIKRR